MAKNIIESKQWEKDLLTVVEANDPEAIVIVTPVSMGKTRQAELREQAALIESARTTSFINRR